MKIDISQLQFVDEKLRSLAIDIEYNTGVEFTITSLYREGDNGVHGQMPVRGMDLRMRNKSTGQAIVDLINKKTTYDPSRPDMKCAILHGEGANLHIHLQVHPRTVL